MPHDPSWASIFQIERDLILSHLQHGQAQLHHIGSTSVPGLPAKPILDLALTAPTSLHDAIAKALVGLGYIDRGDRGGRLFIRLTQDDLRTHNLHLYQEDDPAFADHIAFRDILRQSPEARDAYA